MRLTPLSRTLMLIDLFRDFVDPEVPAQIAHLFVVIARKQGVSQRELIQLTGMGKASVSRNVAYLSKEYGKGLVHMKEDPADRRAKLIYLTPEGERLVARINQLFEEVEV